MDNLVDYVLWMSDIPFSALPFGDVDAMVLSNLSYIVMGKVFEDDTAPVHVRDCRKILDSGKAELKIAISDDKYTQLLQAAVGSKRFGDLLMRDYIDVISQEPPVQYAVVTFYDEEDLAFIAFRGTDDSLAGWYEDFIASFSKTEAQEMAREYATRVISREPDRRWLMGGHSKGGNLALYAGCTMDKELFDHVERIYDLDGPGLSVEVMGQEPQRYVLEKTTRILPEFSVVGRVFDMDIPDTKIIRSFAKGAFQHAPISWGVDHGKIAAAEKHNPFSVWFNDFFARWIACTNVEERRIFFDEVFAAVSEGGAKTLADLVGEGIDGFVRIQNRLKNASEVTKRVLHEFTKQAFFESLFPGNNKKN